MGLLARNYTPLLSQPASGICQTCSMAVSRDSHVVVLPTALEVIPSRADKSKLTGLVVDNLLEFHLDIVSKKFNGIERGKTYFTFFRDAIIKVLLIVLHAFTQRLDEFILLLDILYEEG